MTLCEHPPEDEDHPPYHKRCLFCGRFFCPDPRVGDRQKSCSGEVCKKRRKQESHKIWVKANPEYYRERYGNTKAWRQNNPDYQRRWRGRRREIQDTIRPPTPVKLIRLWYRPGQEVRYKTRSGWQVAIDAGFL